MDNIDPKEILGFDPKDSTRITGSNQQKENMPLLPGEIQERFSHFFTADEPDKRIIPESLLSIKRRRDGSIDRLYYRYFPDSGGDENDFRANFILGSRARFQPLEGGQSFLPEKIEIPAEVKDSLYGGLGVDLAKDKITQISMIQGEYCVDFLYEDNRLKEISLIKAVLSEDYYTGVVKPTAHYFVFDLHLDDLKKVKAAGGTEIKSPYNNIRVVFNRDSQTYKIDGSDHGNSIGNIEMGDEIQGKRIITELFPELLVGDPFGAPPETDNEWKYATPEMFGLKWQRP